MFRPLVLILILGAGLAAAADQTVPGAGNARATEIASGSPRVREAMGFLLHQAERIRGPKLRAATLDILANPRVCARHRAGLSEGDKDAIVERLVSEGLVSADDGAVFPGGLKAGIFPPMLDEGGACPRQPQPFRAAPGSSFGGHHSYPGGLPIHEAFNERSDVSLAKNYRRNYGVNLDERGRESRDPDEDGDREELGEFEIDEDLILAAPIWHDWAKTIVFQWNADGTEFAELGIGGAGKIDNNGAPGDSRTGGHHVLGVAESMKRGLHPAFVIAQACAHSAPTLGNEFKVVNWLRAAAIVARIDPLAAGYLTLDAAGHPRLPALRRLGAVDLNAATPSQTNLLVEYTIHNLSDADFTFTVPAVGTVQVLLATLAPRFGYDPVADPSHYNNAFRNVVLSHLSAERLLVLYGNGGLEAVAAEVRELRHRGLI